MIWLIETGCQATKRVCGCQTWKYFRSETLFRLGWHKNAAENQPWCEAHTEVERMSKAILICVMILSGLTPGVASETGSSSALVPKPDMSKRAAFDQACRDATALIIYGRYEEAPLSARALANVRMCNGHPLQAICQKISKTVLDEYGKTPFTCGSDIAESVPPVIPADEPSH
jgi:hypothetical protein